VPNGFSNGVYLKLVDIDQGSSIPKFVLASLLTMSNLLSSDDIRNMSYFERAKEKIISIIATANSDEEFNQENKKYLPYFSKIGKNLLDNESIDFGYDYLTGESSTSILNHRTRKKLVFSAPRQEDYQNNYEIYALIPAVDLQNNTFSIICDDGRFDCKLTNQIKEKVMIAFNEFTLKTVISLEGSALFNSNDKITEIQDVSTIDILDPMDITYRIHELKKLNNGWYNGQGIALDSNNADKFEFYFSNFFDYSIPLPAIFPTFEGDIQLEWRKDTKNIIVEVKLLDLQADIMIFDDDDDDDDENELILSLSEHAGWEDFNRTLKQIFNGHRFTS
jgi:hypothetical protein